MRRSKWTVWFETHWPPELPRDFKTIGRALGIDHNLLQAAFDRGVGAYGTNYEAVRPSVKRLKPESGRQVWGKARAYKLVFNILAAREGGEINMGRGQDGDLVARAIIPRVF